MDAITRTTSRVLFPLTIVFGVYIALYGHLSPGGAFPAGVIFASGFLMLMMVFEKGDEEYKLVGGKGFTWKNGVEFIAMAVMIVLGYGYIRVWTLGTQDFFMLWSGGYTVLMNSLGFIFISAAFLVIIRSMVKE
jgi:multicomponent Na+:H+ antiporter subunit B